MPDTKRLARVTGAAALIACTATATTALAADGDAPSVEGVMGDGVEAAAELRTQDGTVLGTVTFQETRSELLWVAAHATGVPAGRHGFHIHETGACDAETGFKSAGGHLANGMDHGVLTATGPHPGDLPNVTVHDDGRLDVEFFVRRLDVAEATWFGTTGLFDDDGSAVVLHAEADDYQSQPSGAAGPRIACGVIEAVGER